MSEFKVGSKVKYPEGSGTLYEVVASTDTHSWIKSPKNPVGYVEGNGFLVDATPKWEVGVTYQHFTGGTLFKVVEVRQDGTATVEYIKTAEVHPSQRQFYTEEND